MTAAYIFCAIITTINAFISLGFSIAGLFQYKGTVYLASLYICARSLPLAGLAVVPFFYHSRPYLVAIAIAITLLQALDAVVGVKRRNKMETFGPAGSSIVNLAAITWLIR
jgi:hypothetical protein